MLTDLAHTRTSAKHSYTRLQLSQRHDSAFRNLPNLIYQLVDPRVRLGRSEFPKDIDQNGPRPNRISVQPINMKSTSRTHDDVITVNRWTKRELSRRKTRSRPETSARHGAKRI